jgi:hypothetical protein
VAEPLGVTETGPADERVDVTALATVPATAHAEVEA